MDKISKLSAGKETTRDLSAAEQATRDLIKDNLAAVQTSKLEISGQILNSGIQDLSLADLNILIAAEPAIYRKLFRVVWALLQERSR